MTFLAIISTLVVFERIISVIIATEKKSYLKNNGQTYYQSNYLLGFFFSFIQLLPERANM